MIWKKEIQILNLIIVRLKAIQCRFLKNRYLIFFQKRSSPAWVQRPETHQNVKHLVCVWLIDLLHVMPVVLLSTDGYHPYQPRTGTDRSTWCSSSCRCSRTEGEREVRETLQCFIKWNIYHLSLSCLSAWAPRAEYEQVEVLVRFWQRPSLQRYWDHRATHSPSTLQLTVSRLQGWCAGFTFSHNYWQCKMHVGLNRAPISVRSLTYLETHCFCWQTKTGSSSSLGQLRYLRHLSMNLLLTSLQSSSPVSSPHWVSSTSSLSATGQTVSDTNLNRTLCCTLGHTVGSRLYGCLLFVGTLGHIVGSRLYGGLLAHWVT